VAAMPGGLLENAERHSKKENSELINIFSFMITIELSKKWILRISFAENLLQENLEYQAMGGARPAAKISAMPL
jgi:hypothetical protein